MRIVAGSQKGRKIIAPKGMATRPTTDKVREAIFSSLGDKVQDAKVLDLFAGSGALGLEAISRGAEFAVFVDYAEEAIKTINKNIDSLGIKDKTKVDKNDSKRFLRKSRESFDLIFIDAPYRIGLAKLESIISEAANLLNENGYLIVEHASDVNVEEAFKVEKSKKYGQTKITYLTKGL